MNKKILMLVLGMVALGAVGSIAVQSYAETQKTQVSSQSAVQASQNNNDQTVDEKDVNGNDLETNDDSVAEADQKDAQGNDIETNDDGRKADHEEKVVGTPSITQAKAEEVAKAEYKGSGVLKDTELEMENGILVYTTEFREADGNEVDVKVNAKTGAVVVVTSDKTEGNQDGQDE